MLFVSYEMAEPVSFVVETEAYEGVKRIAEVVASDTELVCGMRPLLSEQIKDTSCIIFATLNKSPLTDELIKKKIIDVSPIKGKRECYLTAKITVNGTEHVLILGSDKRGTIYGMFSLSEYLGVSPLVYWGDVTPEKKNEIFLDNDFFVVSKEPSVKYRGFFINDEWPCYGTWVTEHFGGFNAKSYEKVFELLLRLRGNYIWPAMWSASFPLDGPGALNEELADIYGVIIGYSHHEPCLRASEEWDKVRGENSKYGNEWNFVTNREGILKYWEDALKRSGKYENIITIGMRGERDSSMLGEDASVEENVNLLKEIILEQKALIDKHVRTKRQEVPLLLAVYKEVEEFFYGNEEIEGLKNWDELSDVICMLCEDNHGHMRMLPDEKMREDGMHFGMYYHLDYHGDPVSYEWVDSTPLSKIWSEMCRAYEYGIKDAWIVNVGDLKFHEVPLSYFLSMAYDMDRWGASNPDSFKKFTKLYVAASFPESEKETKELIEQIFTEYIDINHVRRPESLNSGVFSACDFYETDRMLSRIENLENMLISAEMGLSRNELEAFYSMIGYPARVSLNNFKMHLYAGKNAFYARQGRKVANRYKALAEKCMNLDKGFMEDWTRFKDGKLEGMQLASHIGFIKWNDFNARNPVLCTVYPNKKAAINVSRKDSETVYDKVYGKPQEIVINDFMYEAGHEVILEIAALGLDESKYEIKAVEGEIPEWLSFSSTEGIINDIEEVCIRLVREELDSGDQSAKLYVTDGDAIINLTVNARSFESTGMAVKYAEDNGFVSIRADHYKRKRDAGGAGFKVIEGYGKYGAGIRVFPLAAEFLGDKERPSVTFRFNLAESGERVIRLYTAPSNPHSPAKEQMLGIRVNKGEIRKVVITDETYKGGNPKDRLWSRSVLDQEVRTEISTFINKGTNEITVYAGSSEVTLLKIEVLEAAKAGIYGYLGCYETDI